MRSSVISLLCLLLINIRLRLRAERIFYFMPSWNKILHVTPLLHVTWRSSCDVTLPRVTSHSHVWHHNPSNDITLLILRVIWSVFLSWTSVQTWVPYTFLLCCRLTSNLCHTVLEHSLDLECAHAELWPCDFNPKMICSDDWLDIWISWTNFGSLYCVDAHVLRKITRYQITWHHVT